MAPTPLQRFLQCFLQDESGQNLIEYALIAAFIGFSAIVAMTSLTTKIGTLFGTLGNVMVNGV